jgi:integrase
VEQTAAFLATCRQSKGRWAPLYIVLATCGVRISEALGLTWADIDIEGRLLRVERGLVWVGAEYEIGPVKTTAGRRTVSIPALGVQALESLASKDERQADRPVFRSIHNNPPRYDQLHKPLAALCKEAGVPRINVHGLRHVAAALSYKATGDALAVQRRLGHTKVTTTLGIYAYLMTSDANTASAVDGLLGGTE